MRNAARSGGDQDALERLRGDEAALESEIAAARADAAAIVESGRREAQGIAASARRDVERLRDTLRAEEAAGLAAEVARSRTVLAEELGGLAGRAERSRDRALERVIAVVLGRST